MNYNNIIAEYFGSLLLVLSVFASGGNALFIGLTLSGILYVSGKNNPGNVNPAVSIGMYFKGKLSLQELIALIVAQLLGGVSSVYIFKALA